MDAREIIEALGGLSKASKILEIPISTLQYWKKNNKIPRRDFYYVMKMAAKNGIIIFYDEQ